MKRLFVLQVVGLAGCAAYLAYAPKDYVATALIQVTDSLPSLFQSGNYQTPNDEQFTGTVARGFQIERVLHALVARHPELHVSTEFIVNHVSIYSNRLNRTIELNAVVDNPGLANAILVALIQERAAIDKLIYQETKTLALQRVTQRVDELEGQLKQGHEKLKAHVTVSGDPAELGTQLRICQQKAGLIEQARFDLNARVKQLQSKLAMVETALRDARAGKVSSIFTGFEALEGAKNHGRTINVMGTSADAAKSDGSMAEMWTAMLHDASTLAMGEGVYGPHHPEMRALAARLAKNQTLMLEALQEQQNAIKIEVQSLTAGSRSLEEAFASAQAEVQKLLQARFDPAYLTLRQTVSGLESAYAEATGRKQTLLSAAATVPPLFTVIKPPLATDLPTTPSPLTVFVAMEIIVLVLLWLTSPWAGPRRKFATA
ncbi:MAG: hypothetical protein ACKVY0_29560 [Prosthecobacter sp.]|uniref:hypothetical protein n=1 Tax=Prosthecobacter sp. TaxID=1965333 RepID=UPI003900FCEE